MIMLHLYDFVVENPVLTNFGKLGKKTPSTSVWKLAFNACTYVYIYILYILLHHDVFQFLSHIIIYLTCLSWSVWKTHLVVSPHMFGHWLATISHPVAVQVPAGAPQSPAFATQKKRGGHGTGKMCKKNTRFFGSFIYCNGVIYIYIYTS